MPHSFKLLLLAILVSPYTTSVQAQKGPPRRTPAQVGIDYPIVACRMPVPQHPTQEEFPDAFRMSLKIGPGSALVLIHPSGKEEILFQPKGKGSCVDPFVSYDGRTIYFAVFEDPTNINIQRYLTRSPAHIWKLDVATRRATQLTFGNEMTWRDSANKLDPRYGPFDISPVELPDGRILFLSTRDGQFSVTARFPSPAFWRMNADGSNLEKMEYFSMSGCQHPLVLQDGRVIWTHRHNAGRRNRGGHNYALMAANQDLSDIKSFAGLHHRASAWHFATQLSGGDVVTTVYYQSNNFGHGALVRFPANSNDPSGNDFHPAHKGTNWAQTNIYGHTDHYRRIGERLATPWFLSKYYASLTFDAPARVMADGTRTGKSTMPAGAPDGHMVFIWSSGGVHDSRSHNADMFPNMKICFARNGMIPKRNDLIVLKESDHYYYMYPKPLVSYMRIHGMARPKLIADTPNDGRVSVLPSGGPFSTTGSSSVYNRESNWPNSYQDWWDPKIVNAYGQDTAFHTVGQDSYRFADSEIWAAQIVADMVRVDTRYAALRSNMISHNNGQQVWGVLGEIPLRKFDAKGQPILDPRKDPDTSYEVRIPANTPFHHRVIDRNGLMLTAEWTWHSTRAGERKNNCGGCHAHSHENPPLDIAQTVAATPSYKITDFALKTPMIDRDASGKPTVKTHPEKIRVVEYHRDIKPIFKAKCTSCHNAKTPNGIDLDSDKAWERVAFKVAAPVVWGVHQATKWVRRHAATQSLLAWKLYGKRLDGRKNSDRNNDIDYAGQVMPPPGSTPLTFDEKRTIGLWIDLGCLVDLTPGKDTIADPFDDQMYPTMTISGVRSDYNGWPLPKLRVGLYDLHSGIKPDSLTVVVTPAGGSPSKNLAASIRVKDGDVAQISLPSLPPDQRHRIDISASDHAGNIARQRLDVTPRSLSYKQFNMQRGNTGELRIEGARANEWTHILFNLAGTGKGMCFFNNKLCLDLLWPFDILGSVQADSRGIASLKVPLPRALPPLTLFTQGLAIRGSTGGSSIVTSPLRSDI